MAPKNTFKYTVFSTDFGVYLCISLMLSPCLSNLKKSSIFPSIGLKKIKSTNIQKEIYSRRNNIGTVFIIIKRKFSRINKKQ